MGDNARAALITRGLAELVRLGRSKGASTETMMGLAGLGDLVLTCNAMQSRNFSFGHALGQGKSPEEILAERVAVTEGVTSAISVSELAARMNIEMPICDAVKSEPGAWSWDDQVQKGTEHWDGVRNYQANNNMKAMKIGDKGFFYHSVNEKRIVGIVEVVQHYHPDPTGSVSRFGMVEVKTVKPVQSRYPSPTSRPTPGFPSCRS